MKLETVKYCKYCFGFILLLLLPQVISAKPKRFDPDTDKIVKDRILSLKSELDVRYSDDVRDIVYSFVVKHKKSSAAILGKLQMYLPIFKDIIREKNLPKELIYLPMLESELYASAVSPVGATGLWQFMQPTARNLGLRINKQVDERKDPIKSTDAALDYLQYLQGIYKNWGLALAAYNCGPGNVNKAIAKAGGSRNYWKIQKYLPRETQKYVPKFIAILYLVNYYEEHGIDPREHEFNMIHTSVAKVDYKIDLRDMAKDMEVDYSLLKKLNPSYLNGVVPKNGDYNYLIIPHSKLNVFIENYGDIENIIMVNSSFANDSSSNFLIAYSATDHDHDKPSKNNDDDEGYASSNQGSIPFGDKNSADFYMKNASMINDRSYIYVRISNKQSLRTISVNHGVEIATILHANYYNDGNLPQMGDLVRIPV